MKSNVDHKTYDKQSGPIMKFYLDRMYFEIKDTTGQELSANRLQGAIISTYNKQCNVTFWNKTTNR